MAKKAVRIGCYGAMWGDTTMSVPQLLKGGNVNYLVADYLAEVTMVIMAGQKMRKPSGGYATDFVTMLKRHLKEISQKGVKVVVNAGGVNVEACRAAVLEVAKKLDIQVQVGVVLGDDLQNRTDECNSKTEMFTGAAFPGMTLSCNAYLGAFPIAEALHRGCDIVITGRVVDSALVVGPLIYEFGWEPSDLDKLSQGTLAGHLVECGAQGTGGLFTDWQAVDDWANIGFPVVEVQSDGEFVLTKPPGTGGLICPATAAEQLLYEIHDPGAYHVPDVACDWTHVRIEQMDTDTVSVKGARGQPPTSTYKCICTHPIGYRFNVTGTIIGHEARAKAHRTGHSLLARWRQMLADAGKGDFEDSRIEVLGSDFEASLRIGVKHEDRSALDPLTRESASASVSMAQGSLVQPGNVLPVIAGFCFLMDKACVPCSIDIGAGAEPVEVQVAGGFTDSASFRVVPVEAASAPPRGQPVAKVPLRQICWARSGDKGDSANIGLIARKPEFLPLLRHLVTPERVRMFFQPDCWGKVERFDLPGISAMNFLLHNSLGGGGTSSLHLDPVAKTFGQRLLEMEVEVPAEWGCYKAIDYRRSKL